MNFGTIVIFGLIALLGLVLVLFYLLRSGGSGGEMDERIQIYATVPEYLQERKNRNINPRLFRIRRQINSMLSVLGTEELNLQLMRADWKITSTEYILIRLGIMLVGFVLGWLFFGSLLSGLALAILANLLPGIFLRRSASRRQIKFEGQLVDVLVLITGAVKTGFSLLQAMEVVEREMQPPASEEFRRVHIEVGLGISLSQALDNLSERMQNQDLDLVVTAVKIHNQVGGNLSTMLEAVTETVRERDRLFREARVITTQQRYTAYMISLLPIAIALMMFAINPVYIMQLFTRGIYIIIPIFAVIGIIAGHFVLQRITKIEV
ncbi:MAG: type II secretion system F family protein [Anaerolineales bacterium]